MSLIKLTDITKEYTFGNNVFLALNHVSLSIEKNELVAIIGASGSGKSTLMHTIGLLDRPTMGSYQLADRGEVSALSDDERSMVRNEMMGFVFQAFFLLPRFNAVQNVMLPLLYRGLSYEVAQEKAEAMLEVLKVPQLKYKKPHQMSGGQQQRIAIARALVGNPEVLLADEPTGALDSKTSEEVLELFLNLHKQANKTVIIVTHDPSIAERCDRIVTIVDGQIVSDTRRQQGEGQGL